MQPHYVYILYSESAGKYYVGQTPDLETRLLFHNELSKNSYTSRYRPWTLKQAIEVPNLSIARKMENYIKKRKSRNYLIRLIEDAEAVEKLRKRFDTRSASAHPDFDAGQSTKPVSRKWSGKG